MMAPADACFHTPACIILDVPLSVLIRQLQPPRNAFGRGLASRPQFILSPGPGPLQPIDWYWIPAGAVG